MALLRNVLVAAFVLASYISAMPLALDARGIVTNTVTETAWVTVDVTKTVYIDEEPTNAPKPLEAAPPATTTSTSSPSPEPEKPVVQGANAPAAFAEQPAAAPAPSSSSTTPAASAPAATPSVNVEPKTASSSGGVCEGSGSGCSGDVTHYEGGLGACGWSVDTASELAIALPHGLMGTQSNGNPYCGRKVSIKSPESGEIVQATVADKCMGCNGQSIDLTDALFKKVVPNGDGRVAGVEWWFS